jgi:hypothetical protein
MSCSAVNEQQPESKRATFPVNLVNSDTLYYSKNTTTLMNLEEMAFLVENKRYKYDRYLEETMVIRQQCVAVCDHQLQPVELVLLRRASV